MFIYTCIYIQFQNLKSKGFIDKAVSWDFLLILNRAFTLLYVWIAKIIFSWKKKINQRKFTQESKKKYQERVRGHSIAAEHAILD